MKNLIALIFTISCTQAFAHKIKIEVESDVGTDKCDYQLNLENSDRYWEYNFCATSQDARCLTEFNIDIHEYNLQEHYGLGGHTEEGLQLYCFPTKEFKKEIYRLTVGVPVEF